MDHLRFRKGARIVGWVDLVFTMAESIVLIPLIVCTIYLTHFASKRELDSRDWDALETSINKMLSLADESGDKREDDFSIESRDKTKAFMVAVVVMLWIILIIYAAIVILQLVAALKLLRATKLGTDPKVAIRNARFWRVVTIVLLSIFAIIFILDRAFLSALSLLIYIPFIWIVQSYIKELESLGSGLPNTLGQVYYYPSSPTMEAPVGGVGKATTSEWDQPYVVATSSADMPPSYYETTEKFG